MFGISNGFFGDLNDTWSVEQSGAQERSERQRQELICAQRHMGVCQGAWVELTTQLGKFWPQKNVSRLTFSNHNNVR